MTTANQYAYASLVQVCPDAGTDERATFGLLLVDATHGRFQLRFSDNDSHVVARFGRHNVPTAMLHQATHAFEYRVRTAFEHAVSTNTLNELVGETANFITLGAIRPVLIEGDFETTFNIRFSQWVPTIARRVRNADRQSKTYRDLIKRLKRSIATEIDTDPEPIRVPGLVETLKVDLGWVNGHKNYLKTLVVRDENVERVEKQALYLSTISRILTKHSAQVDDAELKILTLPDDRATSVAAAERIVDVLKDQDVPVYDAGMIPTLEREIITAVQSH